MLDDRGETGEAPHRHGFRFLHLDQLKTWRSPRVCVAQVSIQRQCALGLSHSVRVNVDVAQDVVGLGMVRGEGQDFTRGRLGCG